MANAKPKTALEVLEAAIVWFETHEWTNGIFAEARAGEVPVKAKSLKAEAWTPYGALKRVTDDPLDDWSTAYAWMRLHFEREFGFRNVIDWNNQPGMTKEQAIRDMKSAADFIRAANKRAQE